MSNVPETVTISTTSIESSAKSSNATSIRTDSSDTYDSELPEVLVINNVKITPGFMHFQNAYEGKHFEQKLVIQNCGKYLAFIRLTDPNSNTFEFESFKEGISLSPGLKIVRSVQYTYRTIPGTKKGFTTIWVNNQEVKYNFIVTLSTAVLSVEPEELHFGRVDAVNSAVTKTFYIKNSGFKGSIFAIDLGRNPLNLNVHPLKGLVPARSSVPINVEIVGSKEGDFVGEIWIKTNPLLRVVVTVTFIQPQILIRKCITGLEFTLIDFEPTYYGFENTRSLVIKNFSASHSMYCLMAEIEGTVMTLDEAREIDDNYKNFQITPTDGRIAALKGASIQITFSPKCCQSNDSNYAACFIKIIRIDCRDVTDNIYSAKPKISYPAANENLINEITSVSSKQSLVTISSENEDDNFSFTHSTGVCLYGEKEIANVSLRPSLLILQELTLDKLYQRELLVTNLSTILPITVKYVKVSSIDIKPSEFNITPNGSIEVVVIIRGSRLDSIIKKVRFDLFFKSKKIIKKVGEVFLTVTVETSNVEQKNKLKQCTVCNDLPEKLDSDYPYRLNSIELQKREHNKIFYSTYLKNLHHISLDDAFQHQLISNKKLLCLQKNMNQQIVGKNFIIASPFLPLPPSVLYNIKITPKSIKIQKVAPDTTITDFFEIENLNIFPIRVHVTSSKPSISFNKWRYVIRSGEKKKINFNFHSTAAGKYNVNINVVVNDSTLFEITAVAYVVPKILEVETDSIVFGENDNYYKFIRIINPLNTQTKFFWDLPSDCFNICPQRGEIQAEKSLICLISYQSDVVTNKTTECVLTSESGQKKIVTLTLKKRRHNVVFDNSKIDFGNIPLNVPVQTKIILKNLNKCRTLYTVLTNSLFPGISIDPQDGILDELDSQVFIVTAEIKAVIKFNAKIVFNINKEEEIFVEIKGSVQYPSFALEPPILQFRKISPNSFDTLAFKIKNLSECESNVDFDLNDYPEFSITCSEDDHLSNIERLLLKPQESKILFLHFFPMDVTSYTFFLPCIINNILGPAYITTCQSVRPAYFLANYVDLYKNLSEVTYNKIPNTLPVIRITASASCKNLAFSDLNFHFVFYGHGHDNNFTKTNFEIFNICDEVISVCVRIDDLDGTFCLTPKNDSFEVYDVSYKIVLEPEEKFIFEVEFAPRDFGRYKVKLPIFLRGYYDDKIFNYLTLKGVYDTPKIIPSRERLDFEPIALKLSSYITMSLQLENHFEDCLLTWECSVSGLEVVFGKPKKISKNLYLVCLDVFCESEQNRIYDTHVMFKCSCHAYCAIPLTAVVDSCLLSAHAFAQLLQEDINEEEEFKSLVCNDTTLSKLKRPRYIKKLVNRNTTCYPLFPNDDDNSDYALYMRSLQKTLEKWVFSQGCYMKNFCKIPEGFTDFCKVDHSKKGIMFGGFGKVNLAELPILQLIGNFGGWAMKKQLSPRTPTTIDELSSLDYVYKTTSNILQYLRGFRNTLPHIKTKHLLNYELYSEYEKIKHPESNPMSKEIFYRLSKQSWIDVILQIIRIFFHFPIISIIEFDISDCFDSERLSLASSDEAEEDILETGIYGDREKQLITWLRKCFHKEKIKLWGDSLPKRKDLMFLDEDLNDGIILGAVIAHYCPYVQSEIRDMYKDPQNAAEVLHNVSILVKIWNMLKFSYIVSPFSIQKASLVEMLLLTSYLYKVLPSHQPKDTITIKTELTKTNTAIIELENLGGDPIYYRPVFFGNECQLFSLSQTAIVVWPKKNKTVKVKYHAKNVNTTTATLLFSGETPGQKYGKSIAINVVGVPDVTFACMEIPVKVKLYKPCKVSFDLESPFKVKADYSLKIGYQLANKEKCLFTWEEIKTLKIIKEYQIKEDVFQFNEEGKCTTQHNVCCQKKGPRDMWLYFTNPVVGDWSVKLTITGKETEDCYENIDVKLPKNYNNLVCRCGQKKSLIKNCPKIIHAKIPNKNNILWNSRKNIVLENLEGEELTFWSKRFNTVAGTRILKLILNSETHPLRQYVLDIVKYKVQMNKPRLFTTPNKVKIQDVTSEDFFDFPMHPIKEMIEIKTAVLRLVSEDEEEVRFYNINFITEEIAETENEDL